MNYMIRINLTLITLLLISGCSITPRHTDNNPVRIIFHNELPSLSKTNLSDCDYVGTLVASEGRWYNSIYISNTDLTTGAVNKMHNSASEMGANIVYIDNNIDFKTSVTFVGQAYKCADTL